MRHHLLTRGLAAAFALSLIAGWGTSATADPSAAQSRIMGTAEDQRPALIQELAKQNPGEAPANAGFAAAMGPARNAPAIAGSAAEGVKQSDRPLSDTRKRELATQIAEEAALAWPSKARLINAAVIGVFPSLRTTLDRDVQQALREARPDNVENTGGKTLNDVAENPEQVKSKDGSSH